MSFVRDIDLFDVMKDDKMENSKLKVMGLYFYMCGYISVYYNNYIFYLSLIIIIYIP